MTHVAPDPNKERRTLCGLELTLDLKRGGGVLTVAAELLYGHDPAFIQYVLEMHSPVCPTCFKRTHGAEA